MALGSIEPSSDERREASNEIKGRRSEKQEPNSKWAANRKDVKTSSKFSISKKEKRIANIAKRTASNEYSQRKNRRGGGCTARNG